MEGLLQAGSSYFYYKSIFWVSLLFLQVVMDK
ncbi:hypothetical protein ERO13_A03G033666v2 [Gossypium hirsutum]|nr:hypothetical protein ERO13_A03G033666v2 [Gossypium hirsutum]